MVDFDNIRIGNNIKKCRKEKKLTQQELALFIGRTESSVRKYERGLVEIPYSVLIKIADALSVNVFDVMSIPSNEYSEVINKYIPEIRVELGKIFISVDRTKKDVFLDNLSIEIVDSISSNDFLRTIEDIQFYDTNDSNTIYNKVFKEITLMINDSFYELLLRYFDNTQEKDTMTLYLKSIIDKEFISKMSNELTKLIIGELKEDNIFNALNELFEKLNSAGKQKVIEYIKDLLENPNNIRG